MRRLLLATACLLMFISCKEDFYVRTIRQTLGGVTFVYETQQILTLYKDGEFISISQAYKKGMLTDEETSAIADLYYEKYPLLKNA